MCYSCRHENLNTEVYSSTGAVQFGNERAGAQELGIGRHDGTNNTSNHIFSIKLRYITTGKPMFISPSADNVYLVPRRDKNMLNPTWTPLMNKRRYLLGMTAKLTVCTSGQSFHDPWQALNRSVLILVPIVERLSPLTSPRYVKKTVMNRGHQQIWSIATLTATDLASFPGIFESNQS